MSYDIRMLDPVSKEQLHTETTHHMAGGTYPIGGTTELWLNITYNYSGIFKRVLGENGIRSIYGMSGAESIPLLQKAISELNDDVSEDYWSATDGNAKRALCQLLAMAQMRPDGVWDLSLIHI